MDAEIKFYKSRIGSRTKSKKAKKSFLIRTKLHNGVAAELRQIIDAAIAAKDDWISAGNDFNYADDDLMVDYQIYRLKACEARYTYFLKLAKEKGLNQNL